MSDTLVLCYHAISDSWTDPAAVRSTDFAAQLSLLSRLGYQGVTFSEAVEGVGPGRRVAVTFDDAFRSVLTRGRPLLARLGWPATVFAVTDYGVGTRLIDWPQLGDWLGTSQESELQPLSWGELRDLAAAGWEIGSHTCSHPHLSRLTESELRRELGESRRVCEAELERPCVSVAYPYGDCNRSVTDMARDVGYRTGAALPQRLHPIRSLEWPRVGVYNVDRLPRFATKALPISRRLRTRKA